MLKTNSMRKLERYYDLFIEVKKHKCYLNVEVNNKWKQH